MTDGEDACGGEPLLTGQGEEQSWNNSVMAEVLSWFTPVISKDVHMRRKRMLGQRMCGRVTELLRMNRKANHGGTTVIVMLCGKVRVVATRLSWQKFQQHEMHERRRQSLSRDSVNEELVETDDGEGRSYVANVP